MKLSVAIVVALAFWVPAQAQDAPMFRENLQHTGIYNVPPISTLHGVKWKFHTAGRVISSPAVVGDVVYVGSTDSNLYALDLASGALRWKFETQSWVTSSPAVATGKVFFESYDGSLYALDASNGQLMWKFATGGEKRYAGKHLHHLEPAAEVMPDPWDFYLSSPSVWNGLVFFGSGDGYIYALDANSGALKWKFQTGDVVHSSPAIDDGTLYIGSWDSYLYALDASTGKERWRFKTGEDPDIHNHVGIQSSPAVRGGVVYFGCRDSYVYAVDAGTGKQIWKFSTDGSWVNNSLVADSDAVYFATSIPGILHAVNAKTGASLFHLPTGTPVFASMALANGNLYMGNFAGKLTAIDIRAQKPIWSFETEAARQNAPALTSADGSIKFETVFPSPKLFYNDMVVAVDKLFSMGSILSSPVPVRDMVLVGSTDENLYALW